MEGTDANLEAFTLNMNAQTLVITVEKFLKEIRQESSFHQLLAQEGWLNVGVSNQTLYLPDWVSETRVRGNRVSNRSGGPMPPASPNAQAGEITIVALHKEMNATNTGNITLVVLILHVTPNGNNTRAHIVPELRDPAFVDYWNALRARLVGYFTSAPTTPQATIHIQKAQEPPGRRRYDVDEWARTLVHIKGYTRDEVYPKWLEKLDKRGGPLAKPRDSYNHMIVSLPKKIIEDLD